MICDLPPPVAPPFMPKHGPRDGSRKAATVFTPAAFNACASPMVVKVFPSPAGVGFTAVTNTSLPSGLFFMSSHKDGESLLLYLPYSSRCSSPIPACAATSVINFMLVLNPPAVIILLYSTLYAYFAWALHSLQRIHGLCKASSIIYHNKI
ncbi:hypothetical protein D3C71_1060960 [compost metagenome]